MTPTSKTDLYEMLRQAVVNTGGEPVARAPSNDAEKSYAPSKTAGLYTVPIPTMPTADEVATAIIVAALETGEDPIACASRKEGVRCRHYAMHALAHVFPGCGRETLARVVGCPGKAMHFWNNSMHQVVNRFGPGKRANWWNEAAYQRVVEAIR